MWWQTGLHIQVVNESSREEENNDVSVLNYPVWRALRNDLISHLLENIAYSWALTLQFSLKTKRMKKLLASMIRLTYLNTFLLLVFKLLCRLTRGGQWQCVQFKSWVEEKECLSLVFKMRPLLYVLTLLMVAASHVINPITATRGLRLCLPWGYGGRTSVHLSSNNSTNIQAINLPFNVSIALSKTFKNIKKYWGVIW